jgi:HAD superfamily hydrolase (TIGR01458 family)
MKNKMKGVILDIDGVLELKGLAIPGAPQVVEALRDRGIMLRILTNSTLKSRASCTARLTQQGFQIQENEVITASYATALYLERIKIRSCWVLVKGDGMREFLHLPLDTQDPEYIVIGDYLEDFNYVNLNQVLSLLLKDAKLIGMIPEIIDTTVTGPALNVGAWVNMLEVASGVKATYIGKPNPYMFELALQSMQLSVEQVVMVGDQLATDILGANQAGIRSVLLDQRGQLMNSAPPQAKADWSFASLEKMVDYFIQKGFI